MGRVMRVAVVAQAEWATRLRSYIHDHMQAMTVEALLDRGQLGPARRFDVMVVDEATRVVSSADVDKAVAAGTIVVGLFDARHPAGESYLDRLGASRITARTWTPPPWRPRSRLSARSRLRSRWFAPSRAPRPALGGC